jgi:serine/threonine-protein kinase
MDREHDIDRLLAQVLQLSSGARPAFLDEHCANDPDLRSALLNYLSRESDDSDRLLESGGALNGPLFNEMLSALELVTGTSLGPYEIRGPLGAGGMGKVYRAYDTRLRRDVAVKVLRAAFTTDQDRRGRFEWEARVLAQLNHANIATIYGIEESDCVRGIIMELVTGQTLADRIARGPTRWAEARKIVIQITEALEAAHDRGIVHGDLKPANIMLRPDGVVKVLDFGLAKTWVSTDPLASDGLASTQERIWGTATYMSPEQAQGRSIDRRADIWAVGCVLFEMLTGQRAFVGGDEKETLRCVIECEPDLTIIPSGIPPRVRQVLGLCLRKDARDRIGDIRDVRLALKGDFDTATSADASIPLARRTPQWILPFAAALVLMVATAGWWLRQRPALAPSEVRRFTVSTAPAILTIANTNRDIAVVPAGNGMVYLAGDGADRFLYLRSFNALVAAPIRRADSFYEPFVSYDGQWIGYIDENDLTMRKVSVAGGPPISITRIGREMLGATWGPDGTIVFAANEVGTGLQRISAEGGQPTTLTTPHREGGELMHAWPALLPGGRKVLYTIRGNNGFRIGALDLETGKQKILVQSGTNPRYAPSGHLVYAVENTLRAVRLDVERLEVQGDSVPVLEGVLTKGLGGASFDIASDGTLVYVSGANFAPRRLVWVNRNGTREPIPAPLRSYVAPRLSPDGSRAAVSVRDQQSDIWIWDFNRQALTRLTADPDVDHHPVWSPNGRTVIFTSMRTGADAMYAQAADGTGTAERLTYMSNQHTSRGVSPDGFQIIFDQIGPDGSKDLMALELAAGHRVVPLLRTPADEQNGQLSPDGHWLAYESDESGQFEVYVRPYPNLDGGRWQISIDGGARPAFTRRGNELLFQGKDGRLMGAALRIATTFSADAPIGIIEPKYYSLQFSPTSTARAWDASPDGSRFLMIEAADAEVTGTTRAIVVVLNWVKELERLLPARL